MQLINIGTETVQMAERARDVVNSYYNWKLTPPKEATADDDGTAKGPIVISLDLGFSIDPSAAAVIERLPFSQEASIYAVRLIERWKLQTPYQTVIDRTVDIYHKLRQRGYSCIILIEIGGARGVYDMLRDKDVNARAVNIIGSGTTRLHGGAFTVVKTDLASTLAIVTNPNNPRLRVPPKSKYAKVLKEELRNYEIRLSEQGSATFGAFANKSHDDILSAIGVGLIYFERFGGAGSNRNKVRWL